MIGAVPEKRETRRASRYDAVIATLVGFCALCVSAYTAYVQRQQVRAAVWPILAFDSANGPIHFILANKGVGPAIIKNVIVKVDGEPVRNWKEALEKILGPGEHKMNKERLRVSVEICYCSTLGECWTLRASGLAPSTTTEARHCPTPSANSFQQ